MSLSEWFAQFAEAESASASPSDRLDAANPALLVACDAMLEDRYANIDTNAPREVS